MLKSSPVDSCPVCGCRERTYLFSKRGQVSGEIFDLQHCTDCEHIYIDPVPDVGFLNATVYASPWMWDNCMDRYATTIAHVQTLSGLPAKILDYGSGVGKLTGELVALGYDVDCYEPAEYARQRHLPGVTVYADVSEIPTAAYDIVVCVEVLEHCIDPVFALSAIHTALRPGGVFYYTTGVMDDLYRLAHYAVPEQHLNLFTTKSATRALKNAGFIPDDGLGIALPIGRKPEGS